MTFFFSLGCHHQGYHHRSEHQRAGFGHFRRQGGVGQVRAGHQQPGERRLHQRRPFAKQISLFLF